MKKTEKFISHMRLTLLLHECCCCFLRYFLNFPQATIHFSPPYGVASTTSYPFDAYRTINNELRKLNVGKGLLVPVEDFAPTYSQSALGLSLSKDQLLERCNALNCWLGSVLASFPSIPIDGQVLLMKFLYGNIPDYRSQQSYDPLFSLLCDPTKQYEEVFVPSSSTLPSLISESDVKDAMNSKTANGKLHFLMRLYVMSIHDDIVDR